MVRRILRSIQRREREANPVDGMIVGLGNVPVSKYGATRHNIGFKVTAEVARRASAGQSRKRFSAEYREAMVGGARVVLACPTTMMNNSGVAVAQLARWYKLKSSQILVVYDELDLAFGTIRMRPGGGPGGHNGVRSVIQQLGTQEFPRLRVGIGRPTSGSTVNYVLTHFRKEEQPYVEQVIELAADAATHWFEHGIDSAMNTFNRESVEVQKV